MVSTSGSDAPLSPTQVETGFGQTRFVLLKHSERCGISGAAKRAFDRFRAAHPDVAGGWIDVLGQRDLSNEISRRTGTTHASPQVLWLEDGRVVYQATHFDITELALREQLDA